MDIKLSLTPEEDDALSRENAELNPDAEKRPTSEDFLMSQISEQVKRIVEKWKTHDLNETVDKIVSGLQFLPREAMAEFAAIVEKYRPV